MQTGFSLENRVQDRAHSAFNVLWELCFSDLGLFSSIKKGFKHYLLFPGLREGLSQHELSEKKKTKKLLFALEIKNRVKDDNEDHDDDDDVSDSNDSSDSNNNKS